MQQRAVDQTMTRMTTRKTAGTTEASVTIHIVTAMAAADTPADTLAAVTRLDQGVAIEAETRLDQGVAKVSATENCVAESSASGKGSGKGSAIDETANENANAKGSEQESESESEKGKGKGIEEDGRVPDREVRTCSVPVVATPQQPQTFHDAHAMPCNGYFSLARGEEEGVSAGQWCDDRQDIDSARRELAQ